MLGRGGDAFHRVREILILGEEQSVGRVGRLDALLGFVTPHHQQRDQKLSGFAFAQPRDALIDDALDRNAGVVELAAQTVILGEAEFTLVEDDVGEPASDLLEAARDPRDPHPLILVQRPLDEGQLVERVRVRGFELLESIVARIGREVACGDPHIADRFLEAVAGVGGRVGAPIALEGVRDFALASHERDTVGGKSQHRNERDQQNSRADR